MALCHQDLSNFNVKLSKILKKKPITTFKWLLPIPIGYIEINRYMMYVEINLVL